MAGPRTCSGATPRMVSPFFMRDISGPSWIPSDSAFSLSSFPGRSFSLTVNPTDAMPWSVGYTDTVMPQHWKTSPPDTSTMSSGYDVSPSVTDMKVSTHFLIPSGP